MLAVRLAIDMFTAYYIVLFDVIYYFYDYQYYMFICYYAIMLFLCLCLLSALLQIKSNN